MNKLAQVNIGDQFGSPWGTVLGPGVGSLVSLVLNAGLTIAGVVVIFFFIFGGISVIRGAGSGDQRAAAQGKQAVTYAIIGFVVVFAAYWIIRLLEVITGASFLTNPASPGLPPPCPPGSGPC